MHLNTSTTLTCILASCKLILRKLKMMRL